MNSKKQFFPLIDSLRAFACFSVLFFHGITEMFCRENNYYYPFQHGYLGVDLFFVLSGFLITNVLVREYLLSGKVKIINFYIRRFLRLYPPIIISVIIFIIPLFFFNVREAFSNFFFLVTYTGDIVMLFRHFFPYLEYPLYFSHCWSLAIEEQFYIFFPALFLLFLKIFTRKKVNLPLLFYAFNISFILLVVVGTIILKAHFYKFFLWRFFQIFMGVFLALLSNENFKQRFQLSTNKHINGILNFYSSPATLLVSVAIVVIIALNKFINAYNSMYYVFTVISSIIIFNAAFEKNKILNSILSVKLFKYLGKISYGVYLYHFPLFYCTNYLNINLSPKNLFQAVLIDIIRIAIVLIISILSYEFIEKRALNLRKRFEANSPEKNSTKGERIIAEANEAVG